MILCKNGCDAQAEIFRLRADLAEMTELLREYGGHHDGCDGKFGEEYRCRCRWREESAVLARTTELDCLRAYLAQMAEAVQEVLEADTDFRAGMQADWEGDPLTDACQKLREVLVSTAPKTE